MRSLAVVMNGPEAMAGLMPTLSKMSGVIVPIKEANITTENNEVQTTQNKAGSPIA